TRLWLSISIPILLIIIVIGAFLWQQHAISSSTQTTQHPTGTPSSQCATLSKSTSQQLTTMNLALDWTPNTNHTGIYVALAQNWYRAEGIDLHLLPYSASVSPDVLVSTGKADVGVGFTEGIVSDAAVGQPVVSIAAVIQAQRQGVKLNIFPITSYGIPDYYTPNLIASPTEIKQKPELLRKFMLATSCGYEYARAHPQQAAQMLLKSSEVPAGTFPDSG